MNCPGCGNGPPAGSAFCNHCGTKLELVCGNCGAKPPADSRFCNACGADLAAPSTPAAAPRPPQASRPARSPRDYTPKHLVDQILGSRATLAGEHKLVTVLFADVQGSMALAEQLDPEDWHAVLDRFFEILAEGVHRFEGTVNQFTGDGIMALFGAPIAHEDHAQRACFAALHLRDALRNYADELRRTRGVSLNVRMGLNTGDVVVGAIGDDLRMDYTAQGHTVGLAQRMEQLAAPDSAYLTAHTAKLVAGYVDLRDLGEFTLKGVSAPLGVFELRGTGQLRSRLDASRARGFSRFVGRGHEMATLEAALERSVTTSGLTVGVVSDAGTGKSRLCHEFLERCRARGYPVIEASGVAHGRNVPLLPMLALFRAYFGIRADDDALSAREKIVGRLLLLDESLRDDLPMFFNLLGVSDPSRPPPAGDADELQRRAFAAIRALVRADGQRDKPAIVLVEDLHWLDAASDAYLAQIVEATGDTRGLMVVNFRPEYRATWMEGPHYQQLPLTPLGPEAVGELLDDLLGRDASVATLADFVFARAGGNPFFVEEIVQSLVETGALTGARGDYQLVHAIDELVLPATVQALLAARIDRLAEREKHLLQEAAVIGRTFESRVLLRICSLGKADYEAAIRALRNSEFLLEAALYPQLEYGFKHPLTQEVAGNTQLKTRRAATHRAVAQAIEDLAADRLDEAAAVLAHHWAEAGEAGVAARWHARAARWIGLSDYRESQAHWRRTFNLLAGEEDDTEALRLRAEAVTQLLVTGYRVGVSVDDATAWFNASRVTLERFGDDDALARLIIGYGLVLQNAGRLRDYLATTTEANAIAARTGNVALQVAVAADLIYALLATGRPADSCRTTEATRALCGDDVTLGAELFGFPTGIFSYTVGALALIELGRIEDAARDIELGIGLSNLHGSDELRCWGNWSAVMLADARGDASTGMLDRARLAMESAERCGSHQSRMVAHVALALAHLSKGEWATALDDVEHASALWRRGFAADFAPCTLTVQARALLGAGDSQEACRAAAEAAALAVRQGQPIAQCEAAIVLVQALRARDGHTAIEEIAARLDEVGRLIETTGAERWRPHLHRELGEIARLRGDGAAAQRAFDEARQTFAAQGAHGHAARVP